MGMLQSEPKAKVVQEKYSNNSISDIKSLLPLFIYYFVFKIFHAFIKQKDTCILPGNIALKIKIFEFLELIKSSIHKDIQWEL